MVANEGRYRLEVMGPFALYGPDGERIKIASRKGMAVVAMLAMASSGERTRSWLQDRLWASRARRQAQQSLRRELTGLRQLLVWQDDSIIRTDRDRVRLDLSAVRIDLLEWRDDGAPPLAEGQAREFLEGFHLPEEAAFDAWLGEQRQALADRHSGGVSPATASPAEQIPRPSIAVSAVSITGGQRGADRIADAIVREWIDRLSRLRWVTVIAPRANPARAAPQVANPASSARYSLTSELIPRGEGMIWAASLIEIASGRVLWSDRTTIGTEPAGGPAGAPAGADVELQARLWVGALDARIETAEQERVLNKPVDELTSDDLTWRARWHLDRMTREDAAIAETLTRRNLAERPNSPDALVQAAFCTAWRIWSGRQSLADIREMRKLALRAAAADQFDPRGQLLVGMAETWLKQPGRAQAALEQAIALNPSYCQAHMQLGSALYLDGKPEAALAPMEMALRLNPHDSLVFCVLAELGMVHLMLGNYDEAARHADLALIRKPAYWFAHLIKINALARLGKDVRAAQARDELMTTSTEFTIDQIDWLPFVDPKWIGFLKHGLDGGVSP